MIDSTFYEDEKESCLKEIFHRSEVKGNNNFNMLESTFSSMSLSPSIYRGGVDNRPPALSSSSISSIEEMYPKGNNNFSNHVSQHGGAPPSPLSNTSVRSQFYSAPGSGFNSPVIAAVSTNNVGEEGANPVSRQNANMNSYVSRKYSNFESSLTTRTVNSLPTFKEHMEESDHQPLPYRESIFSSFEDDGLHSFMNDSNKVATSRHIPDGGSSVFAGWPSSNANSSQPLNNMGSVDENEQYVGNRSRTLSGTSSLGYQKVSNGSFSNIPEYPDEIQVGSFPQASESYSFDGISVASESALPSRVRYYSYDGSRQSHRQRVMSADALNMTSFCQSGVMASNHFHSQAYNKELMSQNNRPRSFSSGHTSALAIPSGFGYTPTASNANVHVATESNAIPMQQSQAFLRSGYDGTIQYPQQYHNIQQESKHLSGRSYMYEQRCQIKDLGYTNQDRIFPVQQQSLEGVNHNLQFQLQFVPRMVYTVKFKRSQKNFVLSNHINGDIKIGSYVKVEADRGEDLGIVLSRIPIEKFNSGARQSSQNMDIPDVHFKKITRLATDEEISLLRLKEEEEAELLKICRSKTSQRGLPMNVVDAEYQFDRHKLTFFFEASCRVDFRELVRDLFSIYKTRIWMQQIDKVPNSPLSLTSNPSKVSRSGFEGQTRKNGKSSETFGLDPAVAITGFEYKGDIGDEGF